MGAILLDSGRHLQLKLHKTHFRPDLSDHESFSGHPPWQFRAGIPPYLPWPGQSRTDNLSSRQIHCGRLSRKDLKDLRFLGMLTQAIHL